MLLLIDIISLKKCLIIRVWQHDTLCHTPLCCHSEQAEIIKEKVWQRQNCGKGVFAIVYPIEIITSGNCGNCGT